MSIVGGVEYPDRLVVLGTSIEWGLSGEPYAYTVVYGSPIPPSTVNVTAEEWVAIREELCDGPVARRVIEAAEAAT